MPGQAYSENRKRRKWDINEWLPLNLAWAQVHVNPDHGLHSRV